MVAALGDSSKWGTSGVQRYADSAPPPRSVAPPPPPSSHAASYAPPPPSSHTTSLVPAPPHPTPLPHFTSSSSSAAAAKCGSGAWAAMMSSTVTRSPAASVLGAQFLVVFLVLSLLRPPFVMRLRTPVDVPRLNPKAAAAVAAASVGATLVLVRRAALKP